MATEKLDFTTSWERVTIVLLTLSAQSGWQAGAFVSPMAPSLAGWEQKKTTASRELAFGRSTSSLYAGPVFYDDFSGYNNDEDGEEDNDDDDDDDDDDDEIDPDTLGNWRDFRRNLAIGMPEDTIIEQKKTSVSRENEALLESQNKDLAAEYKKGVWAHQISTPEVGGLIVRLPLEAELSRNFKHSIIGNELRKRYESKLRDNDTQGWFGKAKELVEEEMQRIAGMADEHGHIDATTLSEESTEMLQLYLDNQEYWQEVCLVLEKNEDGTGSTVVINRPMAMKLTENLSRLVLYGSYESTRRRVKIDLMKFCLAFGQECAVYVGGDDKQDEPAVLVHGIADLEGAVEISPGSGIYRGGLEAAVDGVLCGKYKPLDFRFFVGCHTHQKESTVDLMVALGKYQPVACARSLVLKQCISLPKPLWHEILELCGDYLGEVSALELLKRNDNTYQVIDDVGDEYEIVDELDELETFDDEDDDYYDD